MPDTALAAPSATPIPATTEAGPSVTNPRGDEEYGDLVAMFVYLHRLPEHSPQVDRHRERIIARCLPLTDHIARRFLGRGESVEDLVQVARVGLVNAVKRFDPDKGSSFVAYAVPTMMGEVRRHFRDNSWAVQVPRRLKELHVAIGKSRPELTQTLGRAPTPSELATHLNVSGEDITESLIASDAYKARSLDAPSRSGDYTDPGTLVDHLGADDRRLDHITDVVSVQPLLDGLSETDRILLHLRFNEAWTQSQIADRIGVSQMQISRMLRHTLAHLRDSLNAPI